MMPGKIYFSARTGCGSICAHITPEQAQEFVNVLQSALADEFLQSEKLAEARLEATDMLPSADWRERGDTRSTDSDALAARGAT